MNDHELQLILSRFDAQDKRFDTQDHALQRIEEHQIAEHKALSARVEKVEATVTKVETKVEERYTAKQWLITTIIALLVAAGTIGAVFHTPADHAAVASHAVKSATK